MLDFWALQAKNRDGLRLCGLGLANFQIGGSPHCKFIGPEYSRRINIGGLMADSNISGKAPVEANETTAGSQAGQTAERLRNDAREALPDSVLKALSENPEKLAQETVDLMARSEGYTDAAKNEFEAEANWGRAFGKAASSFTAEQLKEQSQRSDLDPRSQGFVQFLNDNFSKIAGLSAKKDSTPAKVSLSDVAVLGAMNEVDPSSMSAGVKFLQDNFFKVSGMDNKVTVDRVERLLFDHSFQFFPKDVQERLNDSLLVVKSADKAPSNFDAQGKRQRSGFTEEQAQKLNAADLTDAMRAQALQKGMFGRNTQRFDGKTISKDAPAQIAEAQKRYAELKNRGLDAFLDALKKQ